MCIYRIKVKQCWQTCFAARLSHTDHIANQLYIHTAWRTKNRYSENIFSKFHSLLSLFYNLIVFFSLPWDKFRMFRFKEVSFESCSPFYAFIECLLGFWNAGESKSLPAHMVTVNWLAVGPCAGNFHPHQFIFSESHIAMMFSGRFLFHPFKMYSSKYLCNNASLYRNCLRDWPGCVNSYLILTKIRETALLSELQKYKCSVYSGLRA